MKLLDIVNNPSFQRIAACLRPSTIVSVRMHHKDIPLETLADHFARLSFNEALIETNPDAYFAALDKLAAATKRINTRLTISVEDRQWLATQIASPEATVVAALLAGHVFAREGRFVTPEELARVTPDAERTWRERAQRGDIPGTIKKGKQWLLPASVVSAMYQVDLANISTEPDPDQVDSEPLAEMTPEEMEQALDRARSEGF